MAHLRRPASLILFLLIAAGYHTSAQFEVNENEPNVKVRSVKIEAGEKMSYSDYAKMTRMEAGGGMIHEILPDGRLLIGYRDRWIEGEMVYTLRLMDRSLDTVWTTSHRFGPIFVPVALTLNGDSVALLTMRTPASTERDRRLSTGPDEVILLRSLFSARTGAFIRSDTLGRAPGTLDEEKLTSPTNPTFATRYTLLRSPDSSRSLAYGLYFNNQLSLNQGRIGMDAHVLDKAFAPLSSRTLWIPASSLSLSGGLPAAIDNDGGIYMCTVEDGGYLRVAYWGVKDEDPLVGRYELDQALFSGIAGDDANKLAFSGLHLHVQNDRLVVTTRICQPIDLVAAAIAAYKGTTAVTEDNRRTYGIAILEFNRSTMTPVAKLVHPFDEAFTERLLGEESAQGIFITSAIHRTDQSRILLVEKVNTIVKNPGYRKPSSFTGGVDRLAVVRYGSDGKVQWAGYISDLFYARKRKSTPSQLLFGLENLRNDNVIDIVNTFEDEALRTYCYDAERDRFYPGRTLAEHSDDLLVTRGNVIWQSPSRLYVIDSPYDTDEYSVTLIETTDGTPLVGPGK